MFDVPGSPRRFLRQDIQIHRSGYWKLARRTSGKSPRQLIHPTNYQAKHFSLDVEVGFPPLSKFVAGMLKDFWGASDFSRDVVQNTKIELSSYQAHVGVRFPFSFSVSQTCPVCGGRGELASTTCEFCHGSGKGEVPHSVTLNLPAGVRHGSSIQFVVRLPYSSLTRIDALIEVRD